MYVEQLPGFIDPTHSDQVFKLEKAFYGLKQTPRAWYERLSNFLLEKNFAKGKIDTVLFTKHLKDILIIHYMLMISFLDLLMSCV